MILFSFGVLYLMLKAKIMTAFAMVLSICRGNIKMISLNSGETKETLAKIRFLNLIGVISYICIL